MNPTKRSSTAPPFWEEGYVTCINPSSLEGKIRDLRWPLLFGRSYLLPASTPFPTPSSRGQEDGGSGDAYLVLTEFPSRRGYDYTITKKDFIKSILLYYTIYIIYGNNSRRRLGRNENWRGESEAVSADRQILLVWISIFLWKTCREGWALVNASHTSLCNTNSSYNAVYSMMDSFIIKNWSRGNRAPVKMSSFF